MLLKLKKKVKINAHCDKKMEPNLDDASDQYLSAKRLHTRPTVGSNGRFLLLKPFILPMAKPAQPDSCTNIF